jgi:mevalonate pyrophosphate decarboxylase
MAGKLGLKTATSGSACRSRYGDFVIAMAYGERPEFHLAMSTVATLAAEMFQRESGTC